MELRLTEANLNDPVTRHMHSDFTTLDVGQTVGEALEHMRAAPPPGRIIYFYVVDGDGKLHGVVPTRRLLLSPTDRPIAEVMIRNVIAIPAEASVLDACEFFTLHRLLAFPVVDPERKLLGVIDVDLYTDELTDIGTDEERFGDDIFQLIGVHLTRAQQTSPLAAFRGRFPWLLCNVAGGILAAFLSGIYQDVLGWNQAVLALFIPVVLALAESVSIQSVTLALEGLHDAKPTWGRLVRRLWAEAQTGLLLGAGTALLVALVALLWLGLWPVALCLLGGIVGGVACAATFGLAIPILLRLMKRDPQVAAGPVALVSADVVTLLLYCNLGRALV